MINIIKKWIKRYKQTRDYKIVKNALLNDPKLLAQQRKKYEEAFGVNSILRTPKQWTRLVNVYGFDVIMKVEGLSKDEIASKCTETFKKKYNRGEI
jgi:hypothetical protein